MRQRELRIKVTVTGGDVRQGGRVVPDQMTEDDWRTWWNGVDAVTTQISDGMFMRAEAANQTQLELAKKGHPKHK